MGFLDVLYRLLGRKGTPVNAETVLKRMSAASRDFDGIKLDGELHPEDVFECGDLAVTEAGRSRVQRLYPCRDTVKEACAKLRKRRAEMFYIKPLQFQLEFGLKEGGRVKATAKIDRLSVALPEWLRTNITKPGENVTAKDLGALLDGKYASDALPEWLIVNGREVSEPPVDSEKATVTDLKPGAVVFGRYRIEKELGAGGQGKLFLAESIGDVLATRSRVVLKVLHCENADDENALAEFIKEANTLSNLRDERIVECYECKLQGKVPILAMEYVEGVSLDKYLAEQKDEKISEAETRELLRPIAEALDYAHGKGIYHRDVKPQNIIVRKEPKRIGAKVIRTCLLDFGIAGSGYDGSRLTEFWNVRGTPLYMSPEQKMAGHKPCASMDVYSLAVTAYECVMGDVPYPRGWEMDVKPTPIPSNTAFARSVMKGLKMMPQDRPSTCLRLVDPDYTIGIDGDDEDDGGKPKVKKPTPEELKCLERPFSVYRQMLAQSALRCEKANPVQAEWLRDRQNALRDLTADLSCADPAALVRFFKEIRNHVKTAHMKAEDIFLATDRLVELRSSLPNGNDAVLHALRQSVG